MITRFGAAALAVASLATVLTGAAAFAQEKKEAEKLAPYYPTPASIVKKMLEASQLKPGEKMFDLGSGDGRIVLMAAGAFKADATGVELDESLARQSSEEIKRRKLDGKARIIQGDILTQDYSSADVVTAYLLPKAMQLVRPILEKQLKKGARVIAHDFEMTGWTPEKVESIEDDGEGRSHTIFVYKR
ncbi:MAG TPA: methyltransferase domain-containing protein [Bryobacteraceae bacterium]|nr:methyltransferase domain-containing protein [Bryobacteraceae bacterium]